MALGQAVTSPQNLRAVTLSLWALNEEGESNPSVHLVTSKCLALLFKIWLKILCSKQGSDSPIPPAVRRKPGNYRASVSLFKVKALQPEVP